MKLVTNFIIFLLGLVILGGIAFFGYQFYDKLHAPAASPIKAIPSNAALILKVNKPTSLWQETTRTNKLWKQLFLIPGLASLRQDITTFDSVLRLSPNLIGVVKNNPLYVVFSPTYANAYDLLFLINMEESDAEDHAQEFIEKMWPNRSRVEKSSYANSTLFSVYIKNQGTPVYFSIRDKLFIASNQAILVKQSIDRLSLNITADEDPEFQKIYASSGKNVSANIFIQYPVVAPYVNSLAASNPLADLLSVSNFATWSGLDLIQKEDQWLISGYTVCKENSEEYLSQFAGQVPQNVNMTRIIPGNVAYFSWAGLSDPLQYHAKLVLSQSSSPIYLPLNNTLSTFEREHEIRFADFFLPWAGNEIGTFRLANNEGLHGKLDFGVLAMNDKAMADSCLRALIKFGSKQKAPFTYRSNKIYNLSIPGLLPMVWGNFFSKTDGAYFSFIDNYAIFGKDEAALQVVIDAYSKANTIDKTEEYMNFPGNHSEETTLYFYCNTSLAREEIQSVLNENINNEINPVIDSLQKFEAFGIQVTAKDDVFLTNVYIHYSQSAATKGPLVWQTALENPVVGRPRILSNPITGEPMILATDASNLLYLIDKEGNIQSKLLLPEKPIGEIQVITSKKNDSLLFIFNTDKHLCIFDMNGMFVHQSPFALPSATSTALSISLTVKEGEPVILLPLNDLKIHAYNLDGKEIVGWPKPTLPSPASKPVQEIKVRGKTLLICTSTNGQVTAFNEKGRIVQKPKAPLRFSAHSLFYSNKTNTKGDLLTTSTDGALVYFRLDGRNSQVKFNNFTSNHQFFYHDINDDRLYEFIYFDLNKLYCYNKFKKLLYDYTFPPFTEKPFIIKDNQGKVQVGAVSVKTGDVFLFGKKGLVSLDPVIRGSTSFDIGVVNVERGASLIIGDGKYVKNFQLSKN